MHAEHEHTDEGPKVFGVIAEFDDPDDVVKAAQRAYDHGYRKMDAYTPFPVHGLAEAVGYRKNLVAPLVLCGGLTGALTGFVLQYIACSWHYPYQIGGRPYVSWPMFVPITFELGILFAAFCAVFGMFAMNGLPMPYHPVFNAKGFEGATRDKFYLCIEAVDDRYDENETTSFLKGLGAQQVSVVQQ
ncbi:MAG: DUF3341 domain-containing protein [Candidatus Hydrogenedentales bacterium]|jgi:hypothetical protein